MSEQQFEKSALLSTIREQREQIDAGAGPLVVHGEQDNESFKLSIDVVPEVEGVCDRRVRLSLVRDDSASTTKIVDEAKFFEVLTTGLGVHL